MNSPESAPSPAGPAPVEADLAGMRPEDWKMLETWAADMRQRATGEQTSAAGYPEVLMLRAAVLDRVAAAFAQVARERDEAWAQGMADAAKLLCWACKQGDKPTPSAYPGDWWSHPKAGISCNAGSIHDELARGATP